ncbi:hypothetical protein PMAYCL1PPCAC_05777 [Pristionchus mayeri]|uniref:G protein-coupled receptor n=1 Tax=Pristionchus mayeri TaxID=1317129 RepID=A0AAN5CA93_9BILA|nr:hypothetical protein PMAYCL1PPCAC_05777 [Pristionchus mayeri]
MERALDLLNLAFPFIHATIFLIGASSYISLILAALFRTPQPLKTYSIMIKFGTFNDLIAVCCDFFTMQRLLVIPGNLLYLSLGFCSLISPRSCFLAYCMQLCTLIYSMYVMTASFAYRINAPVGHSGMTPHLIFTILFIIFTPGPLYTIILTIRHKVSEYA